MDQFAMAMAIRLCPLAVRFDETTPAKPLQVETGSEAGDPAPHALTTRD
jgi:hypothetical protein